MESGGAVREEPNAWHWLGEWTNLLSYVRTFRVWVKDPVSQSPPGVDPQTGLPQVLFVSRSDAIGQFIISTEGKGVLESSLRNVQGLGKQAWYIHRRFKMGEVYGYWPLMG